MKFISWNIDSLNAALTSDSNRAVLTRKVIDTIIEKYAEYIQSLDKDKIVLATGDYILVKDKTIRQFY